MTSETHMPFSKASSENPKLCVALDETLIYLCVNSAFVSVARLDFGVFGACLNINRLWRNMLFLRTDCRSIRIFRLHSSVSAECTAESLSYLP